MTCLQLRRQLLTDPKAITSEIRGHIGDCATCRSFVEDLIQFESKLEKAANIPVPDDLAPRIMVRQSFSQTRQRRRRLRPLLAAAAAVVVTMLSVSALYWASGLSPFSAQDFQTAENSALHNEILSHVKPNDYAYAAIVPATQIQSVLANTRTTWQPTDALLNQAVIYAQNCDIDGRVAAHLVMQTEAGPVTAFVLPHIDTGRAASSASWPGEWAALNQGALAVISSDSAAASRVSAQLQTALLVNAAD